MISKPLVLWEQETRGNKLPKTLLNTNIRFYLGMVITPKIGLDIYEKKNALILEVNQLQHPPKS